MVNPNSLVMSKPMLIDTEVIVGTSPRFFTTCAGWMLSVFRRRPFVFELRDLWPESMKTVGAMEDSAALRAMERLELFLYRKAAAVVAVTESFKRNLICRGIAGDKIQVVTNGVDLSLFQPLASDLALRDALGIPREAFVAGYIGTHGMAHALETVLEAARMLENPDWVPRSRSRSQCLGAWVPRGLRALLPQPQCFHQLPLCLLPLPQCRLRAPSTSSSWATARESRHSRPKPPRWV